MISFDYASYFRAHLGKQRELAEFRKVLDKLGNPQHSYRCVAVVGTNGKGSTCAFLSSILMEAGFCTGMYSSPALSICNERFRINGLQVSDEIIEKQAERVYRAEQAVDVRLSGFDRMTATALCIFQACAVDYAVLEAGLGGRLDAVNAVEAEVSIITAIGLDHTHILGETIEEITAEKCGIIKPRQVVVSHPQAPEAQEIIETACVERGAMLRCVGDCEIVLETMRVDGMWFTLATPEGTHFSLYTSLLGRHQLANAAAAVLAARALRIDAMDIQRGISTAVWPGRMEYLPWDPDIILDGAHNPHAVRTLIQALDDLFPSRNVVLVLSIMKDKDVETMMKLFTQRANHVVAVKCDERACEAEELVEKAMLNPTVTAQAVDSVGHAYDAALRYCVEHYEDNPLIVVAGSLYLDGAIREILFSGWVE